MPIEPRAYQDEQDLVTMRTLLQVGRQARTPMHYPHVGELAWQLFYQNQEDDRQQTITLWQTTSGEPRVVGWTLFAPGYTAFTVVIDPALYGSASAAEMWRWSADEMASGMRAQGEVQIDTVGVAAQDRWLQAQLTAQGFVRSQDTQVHLVRPLLNQIAEPCLPPGYRVQPVTGEAEAEQRAAPMHAAFGSQTTFARYWPRYRLLMRAPLYTPDLDLVIEAPDGQLVAFCLCWLDAVNRVGYFEPLGVHPAFQRRGLGRAVLQAGLRLLQSRGMTTATVHRALADPAAHHFYTALSFRPVYQLYHYQKALAQVCNDFQTHTVTLP